MTITVSTKYIKRISLAKDFANTLSQAWKRNTTTFEGTLYGAAISSCCNFKDFANYMKKRHKLQEGNPKRGWSLHYMLQYNEQAIKAAAAEGNKEARAYLLEKKLEEDFNKAKEAN